MTGSRLPGGMVAPVTGSSLQLRAEVSGDTATLFIDGEVDLFTVDALADTLRRLIEAGPVVLCLDLGKVTFCDSMGFRTLILAAEQARDRGSRVVTVGLQAHMLRVVDILGVRDDLGVQSTEP